MTYRIGPATHREAVAIMPLLRAESRAELGALGDDDMEAALVRLVCGCPYTFCGADDDGPLFIGGAVPDGTPGTAIVWMLMSTRITDHQLFCLREMRKQAAAMSEKWPVLRNYTNIGHDRTTDWLTWLGFKVGDPMVHPQTGNVVLPFERRVEHV